MPKSKKVVATADVSALAAELHQVTSIWRPTHVISGHALEFVKEKVAAINEALNPSEEEEKEVVPEQL